MPGVIVYDRAETSFSSNGIGPLSPTSCRTSEQVNGAYELELIHPLDDSGRWARIVEENIIKAMTPYGYQPFRVYAIDKDAISKTMTVRARHLFYDLLDNFLEDIYPTQTTADQAVKQILGRTQYASGFTGSSDISVINNARYVRTNPVAALMGTEDNSVIHRWGGEIERDYRTVKISQRRGANRGVSIRYGKNLTGLVANVDTESVATRIMPTGLKNDDTVLILPEKYIDSSRIDSYVYPKIRHVHFTDVKVGTTVDDTVPYPDEASAFAELRKRVQDLYAAGADTPNITLNVQMIDLSQTEEYKDYAQLEQVFLGDTVTVKYDPMNIDYELRVTGYTYDSLAGRYESLIIGDLPINLGQSINDVEVDLSVLDKKVDNAVMQGERYSNISITHKDGFKAESSLGSQDISVNMSAADPLAIRKNGVLIGGLMLDENDNVVMLAERIQTPESMSVYAAAGRDVVDGQEQNRGAFFVYEGTDKFIEMWQDADEQSRIWSYLTFPARGYNGKDVGIKASQYELQMFNASATISMTPGGIGLQHGAGIIQLNPGWISMERTDGGQIRLAPDTTLIDAPVSGIIRLQARGGAAKSGAVVVNTQAFVLDSNVESLGTPGGYGYTGDVQIYDTKLKFELGILIGVEPISA